MEPVLSMCCSILVMTTQTKSCFWNGWNLSERSKKRSGSIPTLQVRFHSPIFSPRPFAPVLKKVKVPERSTYCEVVARSRRSSETNSLRVPSIWPFQPIRNSPGLWELTLTKPGESQPKRCFRRTLTLARSHVSCRRLSKKRWASERHMVRRHR